MAGSLSYVEQLRRQLQFLETSCREYDSGNVDEAIRIATALRVIFHNTSSSTSLLMHLGATGMSLLSTCGRRPSNHPNGYWPAFVQIDIDVALRSVHCRPIMNAKPGAHRFVPFNRWWYDEIVYVGGGHRIRRKAIVLDAANKDGGAHVDEDVPRKYQFFLDGAAFSFGVESVDGRKTESRLVNAHLACLRQIAHEVLSSPDIAKLAGT